MKSKRQIQLPALALCLALAVNCAAQPGPNWRVYKAADGLPETTVASITIGPHGNLWVRHPAVAWIGWLDGYEIKALPSPGLGKSRVYESDTGQIWTFTDDGLQRYRDQATGWISFATPELRAELRRGGLARPLAILPARQNHVLLLLPQALLDCNTDNPSNTVTTLLRAARQSGLEQFSSMTLAHDGGLWLAGAKGLAKMPGPLRNLSAGTPLQEYLPPERLKIHNLREPWEGGDGKVIALAETADGSQQVLAGFDGRQWGVQSLPAEKIIQAWRTDDGTIWVCSASSLFKQEPGRKQFAPADAVSQTRYSDLAVESKDVFWLATSDGLLRYAPLVWRQPPGAGELDQAPTLALTPGPAGLLCVATPTKLHVLQEGQWSGFELPAAALSSPQESRALYSLPGGTIALGATGHLFLFHPLSGEFSEASLPGEPRPLGVLKDGNLCLASWPGKSAADDARLLAFNGTNSIPFPFPQPEIGAPGEPLSMLATQNGELWLVLENGLQWYHNGQWQNLPLPPPIAPASRVCLLETGGGKIWCGIQDAIHEFDGQKWIPVRAGFYRINEMIRSGDNSVWVASDNGLHRFFRGTWAANSVEEGLPNAAVREVCEDRQGRIWAGTARGLSQYHPEADPDPPRTYVSSLPGQNTVPEGGIATIEFSAQDKWKYTPEDRLVFSYQLDGQEWSPYQEQRKATFLDLSAGTHAFRVRSMDRNWNVDPSPALLQFTVAAPWYSDSRLMFISCTGLGAAIFFAGLAYNRHRQLVKSYAEVEAKVALRTQQLEQANQELFHSQKMTALGTLAAGIAHDFNNILSIIKGSAQIIEDNLGNENKIRVRTDRIKTVVEQGAGIVKAMLGFSRGSHQQLALCDINSIVAETIKLLGDRFLREMEVRFTPADPPPPEVPASKDFVQQILLNLIFNAADASTGQREIVLSVTQSAELPAALALKPVAASAYVFISVQDFGSGIAPEVMPRIFEPFFTTKSLSARRGIGLGLSMAYELARQMDGGLGVTSVVGQGTTFILIIPVRPLPVDATPKSG